jgi:RNA polymerase sigma factor (sigma-70 family)
MGIDVHTWTEEALVQHGHFVRRLARTLALDENEAEDLAQGTWLVALRQAPSSIQRPRAWLASVLRSVAFTRRRAESRRRARSALTETREDAQAADCETEELELQQNVVAAVLELDPPYRSVIVLRYYRGLSLAEIAHRTGAPVETVRTRLKRGHELLRRKLDREYGDRTTWCVAAALSPLPRPAVVSLGITPLTTLGGMIMGWKYAAVAALALAAVTGLSWSLRGDKAPDSRGMEPATPEPMAELSGGGQPPSIEVAAVEEFPAQRKVAADPPKVEPVAAPLPGVWLVGKLVGGDSRTETPARLIVDSAREHPWEGDSETEENGLEFVLQPPLEAELLPGASFEVDLTELFARGEATGEVDPIGARKFAALYDPKKLIEVLELQVFHERLLPLERRLQVDPRLLARIAGGERVEIAVELRLESVGTTIEGRVVLPKGVRSRPIHVALFRFDHFGEDVPDPAASEHTTCDEEGRFTIDISKGGRAVLVVGTDAHRKPVLRPESSILDVVLGQSLHLPPIELTEGKTLAGQVVGMPADASKYQVDAYLVGGEHFGYHLNGKGRNTGLKWIDGAFELDGVHARTASGEPFSLQGLAAQEYELVCTEYGSRSNGGSESIPTARFEGAGLLHRPIGGTKVRAPATGVTLDPQPDYATFQLIGDGKPLANASGKMLWVPRAGGVNFKGSIKTDEKGRARIAIGKGMELDCWVVFSAPGWWPCEKLHVNEYLGETDDLAPIELERAAPPVTLRLLVVRTDGGEVAGSTWVSLRPWPGDTPRPDLQEAGRQARLLGFEDWLKPVDGEFRIDGLQPGRYWCQLTPGRTRGSDAPWRAIAFELHVPAQAEAHHTHEVGPGCHVRVEDVASTGLESRDLFVMTTEGRILFNPFADAGAGAFQTTKPLDPGDYVLWVRGISGGDIKLPFTAVDGEVTELKPELGDN